MLSTPLGDIDILIDNERVSFVAVENDCDKSCTELQGRYYIRIEFVPDGKPHEILCCIRNHSANDRDDMEPGDRLELKSFYENSCKLSIGMEGDSGYYYEGDKLIRIDTYDYDNEYTENGVKYIILPETKTSAYIFGIAWIEGVNEGNDYQTWYGADPTIMKID